ncbi:50S ribosomal protein L3 [Candidatus Dependentiae bacterium]|nr:MAG: 50S ribosomal protein L3 [Candidatus Dependentiae bacterium]
MINGVWGIKVGMTQLFVDGVVKPVTAIDVGHWVITDIKNKDRNGYNAMQVGCLRKRYRSVDFNLAWLKHTKKFFLYTREIRCSAEELQNVKIGNSVSLLERFAVGNKVDVMGVSKGVGFAGVYKRHGFGGAAKTHGSMMGRRPGSIGFTRSSGEIMRGQMMAGHAGCDRVSIKNLEVATVITEDNIVMVKGSVPGKSGSLVFVKKHRL